MPENNPPLAVSLESLLAFEGPPEVFAFLLLAERCGQTGAEAGALFLFDRASRSASALAVFPPSPDPARPPWLDLAAQALVGSEFSPKPRLLPGGAGRAGLLLVPLGRDEAGGPEEYACFLPGAFKPESLSFLLRELGESAALWRSYLNRRAAGGREDALFRPVLTLLAEIGAADNFKQAAMAFVNELAARFACDRAALGFLEGRYVHLAAVNHAEKVGRKMDLPRLLELVMEECLDQDEEVFFPAPPEAAAINRAQAELVRRFGSGFVLALPLRRGEELLGAVVLERARPQGPSERDLSLMRLAADLAAPRLKDLKDRDRWLGARAAAALRESLAWLLGPKHTWAKLLGLSLGLFLALALGLRVTYRVEATFTLKAGRRLIVAAPFDGFLQAAPVVPGDRVEEGRTLLARLETAEDQAKLLTREAEARAFHKEAALAQRARKTAEAQIATARAEQAEAECAMLRERIARSEILAPGPGLVLTGDWQNRLGGPVKLGETLFEIAPLEGLEAELYVSDEDIADIRPGRRGELAVAGNPGRRFPFVVRQVSPAAELVKQKNVFRVLVDLEASADWLRPGMEGLAKIEAGRRSPAWIWTRPAVNWLRMKLWL